MDTLFLEIFAIGLILFLFYLATRGVDRKQEKLFQDHTSPSADVRGLCYVRESFMEEPGVAQVIGGKLLIHTVTGKNMDIPLDQLKVTRIRKNYLLGRYPWFGKTIFNLDTPKTHGLALGFKDPHPWQAYLKTRA